MKKFALPALAATLALSLAACGEANAPEADGDGETVVKETVVPAPSETTIVTDGDGMADDGDSVTISEDGVQADVGDGDTQVTADVDGDPSLTVHDGN